jgi:hypothetical protein
VNLLHHLLRKDRSILSEPIVDTLYIQLGAPAVSAPAGERPVFASLATAFQCRNGPALVVPERIFAAKWATCGASTRPGEPPKRAVERADVPGVEGRLPTSRITDCGRRLVSTASSMRLQRAYGANQR